MNIATIFDGIPAGNRSERGFAGEYFARKQIEKAGYIVERQQMKKSGDLRAVHPDTGEAWKIEVKTARKRSDGRFCFHLICNSKKSVTDYRHADYVMLIAVHPNGVVSTFLIPSETLKRRGAKTITLPVNLNGSAWADYRVKGQVSL